MSGLTEREIEFLSDVMFGCRLRSADRIEDRVRQKMRRLGYAKVEMNPRRWVVTDAGRAALAETPEGK